MFTPTYYFHFYETFMETQVAGTTKKRKKVNILY